MGGKREYGVTSSYWTFHHAQHDPFLCILGSCSLERSSGSTVVRRRLGSALREHRERANVRIEHAARELECSAAKVSRLENGLGPAKTWEVRVLLSLYGVEDAATRAQFDAWAAATKSTGWWESDADLVSDDAARLLAVETESVLMRGFSTPVLPAILRTADYHRAHTHASFPALDSADTERLTDLRHARQAALLDPANPLRLVAVADEAAVRRQVGGPQVHSRQLGWLADLLDDLHERDRDDVTFHVLPLTGGTVGRAVSAFVLFTPRDPELDPVTAFVDDACGGGWRQTAADVAALDATFTLLLERTLSAEDSRALLRELHEATPTQRRDDDPRIRGRS
ncbi:MAG: helix-turn-helix domain-containing protein [Pseudonocardia sp.]